MFINDGVKLIRFINLDIEKEIEIPENVKIIGKSCFKDEDIIQTVSIFKNIRSIEESVFENCKLKTICFGGRLFDKESSVEKLVIESNSFRNCEELREVFINANCDYPYIFIKRGAFANCKKLRTFYILSDDFSNINIDSKAFEGVDKQKFRIMIGGNGDPADSAKFFSDNIALFKNDF